MATKKISPVEPPAVGERIKAQRQQLKLSLDDLSLRAGVSKSMLSQIERNQANPTVAVVWRLANALEIPLPELLGSPAQATPSIVTVPAHAIPCLRTQDERCELRILGPVEMAGQFEWYELMVQPGGVLDSQAHEPGSREHLSVLTGALEVTAGQQTQRIKTGETARYAVDQPHTIRNTGKSVATGLLVVVHP